MSNISLTVSKQVKIECIKQGIKIEDLAVSLNMSRQLMWHHLNRNNKDVISKVEEILALPHNSLLTLA